MKNIPKVCVGFVVVSRDCFPITLAQKRADRVIEAYNKLYGELIIIKKVVVEEQDVPFVLQELSQKNANALVIYLGNFGPEGPETLLAQLFQGPVMLCAASEECSNDLRNARGDAYCGLLNASYNLGLRGVRAYIPEQPVGNPNKVAEMIFGFVPIARIIIGLHHLRLISFGPRPSDFFACNAPLKPFYDLELVSIQENSELDLLDAYNRHKGDSRIKQIADDMAVELGRDNNDDFLQRIAQFELTLLDWIEANKGAADYIAFANKCWPAFTANFGFVPCYVNGRLTARGIPVACEVDLYGALSEFLVQCATGKPSLLLDINNTIPDDMYDSIIKNKMPYRQEETFMAFHCGNGFKACMSNGKLTYHAILKASLEPCSDPDITRGTFEGNLNSSAVTLFRLHGSPDGRLCSYIAQGEILPVDACSFGTIGVFGIPNMARFYRHVLIEKHYPHHCAVAFEHAGHIIFEALKMMGITDIEYNRPATERYISENPFSDG